MSKNFFVVALSVLMMLSASGIALGYDYGSKVAAADTDRGHALVPIGAGYSFFELDSIPGYSTGDPVYLKSAGPADRLTPVDALVLFPGDLVGPLNADFLMSVAGAPLAAPAFVYLPINGPGGAYHPADPVYLVSDTAAPPVGHLKVNDIRISLGNPNGNPGTKVVDFNLDNNLLYTVLPGWAVYYDNVDGIDGFTLGDELYLHDTALPSMVVPGDIRLTKVP